MSSILAIFQGFQLYLKQVSKFQMFIKFPEQLFSEHTSITTYAIVNLIHIFTACLDSVWCVMIACQYCEYRFMACG